MKKRKGPTDMKAPFINHNQLSQTITVHYEYKSQRDKTMKISRFQSLQLKIKMPYFKNLIFMNMTDKMQKQA